MIVFVRTKNETETLAEKLRARGYSAMAINGDVAQVQRERTINQLKAGKLDILVATDVAARGLDVERISHVVNYDIPTDTESYVHRIGRTGRAGRTGDSIAFVTPRERHLLRAIEKATRQPLTQMQLPTRRRRQRHAPLALRRPDHPGADAARAHRLLPRRGLPLRQRARRVRGRRGRRPGRGDARRAAAAARARAGARRAQLRRAPDPRRQGRPRRRASRAAARRWRRTASRSASGTRSSRARSSARWPTRAACRAATSATSRSSRTSPSSSCPPTCRPARSSGSPSTRISGKLIEIKPDNGPFRGRPGGGHRGGRSGGGYKGKNPR